MKWLSSSSIKLTKILTMLFALAILALDISAFWVVEYFARILDAKYQIHEVAVLIGCIYIGSASGYYMLFCLYRLLINIETGVIFTVDNIRNLRRVSWCCSIVSIICFIGGIFWISLIFIAVAAGFVAMVVRVVKNVFERALELKSELDSVV